MKLFKDSRGFIFAFGFNMVERKPDPHMICWHDPAFMTWEAASDNMAGSTSFDFAIAPEYIHECQDKIVAYQPGVCLEISFIGYPFFWSFKVLRAPHES